MKAYQNPIYLSDVAAVAAMDIPWEKLSGKTVVVSGATGLLGSCLVDVLMRRDVDVVAISRNRERALERFSEYAGNQRLKVVSADVNSPLPVDIKGDYVIHLASNTHPVQYATEPVATIMTNIKGLENMLECARRSGDGCRFAFASSNEVYGTNRGDVELFKESDCGYIDCNTLRAGYPESKRCGEALCQAYARQYGMDVVIPRFTRSFGPTLLASDTKAMSQFLGNAVRGEDIVLKSKGDQYFSYTYVTDAVAGLLYILLLGESGQAYNIADEGFDITLRDLAEKISAVAGTRVIFDLPSETEAAGFSKATVARLDSSKLKKLGWKPMLTMDDAIEHTLKSLR